jgi:hypothetical protein
MTKKEMIKTIQKHEAELFLKLKVTEDIFGEDHIMASKSRSKWLGINNLMETLKIESDNTLPENKKAIELINKKSREAA